MKCLGISGCCLLLSLSVVAREITLPQNTVQWRRLPDFLRALDAAAAGYTRDLSSLQKNASSEDVKARGVALVEGKHMTIKATVRDVLMQKAGTATIYFIDLDTGGYLARKDRRLNIQSSGKIQLQMSKEEALKIEKGMSLHLGGEAVFTPAFQDHLAGIMQISSSLLPIWLRADSRPLGALNLKDPKWKFTPAGRKR